MSEIIETEKMFDRNELNKFFRKQSFTENHSHYTQDQMDNLKIVVRQAKELLQVRTIISCGKCDRRFRLIHAYRCFYCGILFCTSCAEKHFPKQAIDSAEGK